MIDEPLNSITEIFFICIYEKDNIHIIHACRTWRLGTESDRYSDGL